MHCSVVVFLSFLLFSSCEIHQGKTTKTELTKEWKKIVEESDSLIYNHHKDLAKKNIIEGFKQLKHPSVLDSCYYYKFWVWLYSNIDVNYVKALDNNDSIGIILRRNNATVKYAYLAAFVDYWRGDIMFQTGDYKAAYDAYFAGKELAQKEYNPCELSNFYYRLAMVLYKQERFGQSAIQFEMCLELSHNCNDYFSFNYRKQEVIDNIALCFYHQHKNDSALFYFNKAVKYIDHEMHQTTPFQDTLYEIAKGIVYGNIGSVYEEMNQDSMAVFYYKKNIGINKVSNREIKDAIKTQIKLARLFLKNKEHLKFWYAIDDCRSLLEKYYDAESMANYYSQMAEHLLDRDSTLALQFFLKAKRLNDSLEQVEKNIKAIDLRAHITELEKEHQI
jgi:tetratricopeptide (TPR) repeat protein